MTRPLTRRWIPTLLVLAALGPAARGEAWPETLAADSAADAPRVGSAGELARVQISGCSAFSADEIRSELSRDFVVQLAVRPTADLLKAVDALRDRALDGYLHKGFLNAKVAAGYDAAANRLTLHITEGQRFVAGDIRIDSAGEIDFEELRRRLQSPKLPRPWTYAMHGPEGLQAAPDWHKEREAAVWSPGEAAKADVWNKRKMAKRVIMHLADMGRPFAKCDVEIEEVAGTDRAELVLAITDPGPAAVIRELDFKGLTRHTAEELQAFLDIKPGSPVNSQLLQRICEQLRTSCRMWKYDVVVALSVAEADARYATKPQFVDVRITVEEYEEVPKLDQPLPAIDAALARAAAWIERFGQDPSEKDLAVEGKLLGIDVHAALSPERGVVARARHDEVATIFRLDLALVDGPGDQQAFDWVAGARLSLPGNIHPNLQLTLEQASVDDRKFANSAKTGLGFSTKDPDEGGSPLWAVRAEPVALVNYAHRDDAQVTLEGGVLTVSDENLTMRFDEPTGALIEAASVGSSQLSWRIAAADGGFARLRQEIESNAELLAEQYDPAAPLSSIAGFVASVVEAQPWAANHERLALACSRLRTIVSVAEREMRVGELLRTIGLGAPRRDEEFVIPVMLQTRDGEPIGPKQMVVTFLPRLADALFPHDDWAWTWTREIGFQFAGDQSQDWKRDVGAELQRAFDDPDVGPLGLVAMAQVGRVMFGERLGRLVAQKALQRLDEADVRNDARLLAVGDHGLARIVRGAAESCQGLDADERAKLVAATPESYRGIVETLLDRRTNQPDEPLDSAIDAALVESWEGGLRDAVRADLEKRAQPTTNLAEAPSETVVE